MARTIFSSNFINIADLYVAYRKAKSEAFNDGVYPIKDWNQRFSASGGKRLEANYRLTITPTIDLQKLLS